MDLDNLRIEVIFLTSGEVISGSDRDSEIGSVTSPEVTFSTIVESHLRCNSHPSEIVVETARRCENKMCAQVADEYETDDNRGAPKWLVYECKNRSRGGKRTGTATQPAEGCGCYCILRTRTIKGKWNDPWVGQCYAVVDTPEGPKKCGKRNWLNDDTSVTVHASREEALMEIADRQKSDRRGLI
jgi:hypothetical protein